jgi:hypothetical protein
VNPDQITAQLSDGERARLCAVGKTITHFSPSISNVIAAFILGFAAFGGGSFAIFKAVSVSIQSGGNLAFWAERGWSWGALGLLLLLGIVGIGVGAFLCWAGRDIARRHVYLCDVGFWYSKGETVRVFPWNEIAAVQETVLHEKLPLVKGPAKHLMPTKTSSSYAIERTDGEKYRLTASDTAKFQILADAIRDASKAHGFPWQVVEERI